MLSALQRTTALTRGEHLRLAPSARATENGRVLAGYKRDVLQAWLTYWNIYLCIISCGFCSRADLGICFSLFKAARFIPFHKKGEKYSAISPVVSWHLPPKFCFTNTGQNVLIYPHLVYKHCQFSLDVWFCYVKFLCISFDFKSSFRKEVKVTKPTKQ